MADTSNTENARAASEARNAVVSRPRSSSAHAVDEAMRRYLGAEQYQVQHAAEPETHEGKQAAEAE